MRSVTGGFAKGLGIQNLDGLDDATGGAPKTAAPADVPAPAASAPPKKTALTQPGDGTAKGEQATIYRQELQNAQAAFASATDPADKARKGQDILALQREMTRLGITTPAAPAAAASSTLPAGWSVKVR